MRATPEEGTGQPPSLDRDIGQKLRWIREINGLSQRELARRAGVTNSSISMIEQGQVSPSIHSLAKLLAAIPMSLAQFFSCEPGATPAIFFSAETVNAEPLSWGSLQCFPSSTGKTLGPLRRLLLGGDSGESPQQSLYGQVLWVASGQVRSSAGEQVRELGPGEGVYLPAGQAHRLQNIGSTSAEVLIAVES